MLNFFWILLDSLSLTAFFFQFWIFKLIKSLSILVNHLFLGLPFFFVSTGLLYSILNILSLLQSFNMFKLCISSTLLPIFGDYSDSSYHFYLPYIYFCFVSLFEDSDLADIAVSLITFLYLYFIFLTRTLILCVCVVKHRYFCFPLQSYDS